MRQQWIVGLFLWLLFAGIAQASDYVFNCRNEWTQDVLITVPAESIDMARKALKTNKKYLDKYSLDSHSQCAFRSELPSGHGTGTTAQADTAGNASTSK